MKNKKQQKLEIKIQALKSDKYLFGETLTKQSNKLISKEINRLCRKWQKENEYNH